MSELDGLEVAEVIKLPSGQELTTYHVTMSPEFETKMKAARAEWKRLEEAGTPYWCTHKGRQVDHPRAYWKPDQYEDGTGDGIHSGHGVMCADCGGYIQEG